MVSVLLCRSKLKRGIPYWVLEPNSAERTYITLVCTMNEYHDRVLDYFLLPRMDGFKAICFHDSFLRTAERLHSVKDFYTKVIELRRIRLLVSASTSTKRNNNRRVRTIDPESQVSPRL